MDDTKKLIEKYKRELMELSKNAGKNEPEKAPQASRTPQDPQPPKAPQIIGYADNKETYDKFLSEVTGNNNTDTAENASSTGERAEGESAADRQNGTEANVSDNSDTSQDDPFEGVFDAPNFVTVPSVRQVQDDSTAQGDSTDDDPKGTASGVTDNSATEPRPDLADTGSTTEEIAERLDDIPISGISNDPDEQLTGRSFEDGRTPENDPNSPEFQERNGSKTAPIDYPEITYESYEDFQSKNIGRGTLQFRAFAARQAFPVSGVKCVISKKFGGVSYEIVTLVTDRSGQTRAVALPAPSKELSQDSENDIQPFALYDAVVFKEGFAEVVLHDIPVFDGIQSIQKVAMIPISSDSVTEEITEVPNADS